MSCINTTYFLGRSVYINFDENYYLLLIRSYFSLRAEYHCESITSHANKTLWRRIKQMNVSLDMHFSSIDFAWLSLKATRLRTSTLQPTIISLTSNDIHCILITARYNDSKLSVAIINYFYFFPSIFWYLNISI